jgi:excisionase family DNA binding protein
MWLKASTKPAPTRRLFSVDDIATALGVSTKTVRRMIDRGELISHQIGKLVSVSEEDLATYLKLSRAQIPESAHIIIAFTEAVHSASLSRNRIKFSESADWMRISEPKISNFRMS